MTSKKSNFVLRSCPFCGADKYQNKLGPLFGFFYAIRCGKCGNQISGKSIEEAMARWNGEVNL